MKAPPVDRLVHEHMFPRARPNEPANFNHFLTRHLVPEVRSETQAYYGHLKTDEAKYPGLDYNNATHRIRLARYTWHRRLFRAFDALGLTPSEISALTRWEGTKWAKDKYELEHGVVIRDTAGDHMLTWDDELDCCPEPQPQAQDEEDEDEEDEEEEEQEEEEQEEEEAEEEEEEQPQTASVLTFEQPPAPDGTMRPWLRLNTPTPPPPLQQQQPQQQQPEGALDDDAGSLQSVGVELNARLRAGVAAREAGYHDAVLDEEWEQWLKHVVETGLLHDNMPEQSFRRFFESTIMPAGVIPAGVMAAARAGRWSEVPDFLHNLLRRALQSEQLRLQNPRQQQQRRPRQNTPTIWSLPTPRHPGTARLAAAAAAAAAVASAQEQPSPQRQQRQPDVSTAYTAL